MWIRIVKDVEKVDNPVQMRSSYRFCQRFWDLKTRMKSKIVLVRYKCDLSEKEKILIRKTELLLDNTEMIKNMKQQLTM